MKIVIFADAWGAKYGGINTFNYDFCKALGMLKKVDVHVFCIEATMDNINEAKQYNINLHNVTKEDFKKNRFEFEIFRGEKEIYWVGHDVKTGSQAIAAKEEIKNGKTIIFNHMNYSETAPMKDQSERVEEKVNAQINIFSKADIIFCVGPKLYSGMIDAKNNYNYPGKIIEILPGLIENEVNEKCNNSFNILISGRIEGDNDRIKQIKTAVLAAFDASSDMNNINVTLIGADNNNDANIIKDEICKSLDSRYIKYLNLIVLPYNNNRNELFKKIKSSSVCLMLSLSEGFGLVGLEAIASGIPLIINENSGLYEFLKRNQLAFFVHSVNILSANASDINNTDVNTVSSVLKKIIKNQESSKNLALYLYNILKEKLTWTNTAKSFLKGIGDFEFSIDSSTIFPNELFDISLNGNIFYAKKGFETAEFYKRILNYAEKRLWIFGRKNRKLFSNDNNTFFEGLKYKREHGFDFRCLFQDFFASKYELSHAQRNPNFKLSLSLAIKDAANKLNENMLNIADFCKVYKNILRNEVIIVIDDKIIIHEITRNEDNTPEHLTGNSFYIIDTECFVGKKYLSKFNLIWESSSVLSQEYINRIDSKKD